MSQDASVGKINMMHESSMKVAHKENKALSQNFP
jgi:hypothetical protein